MYEVQSDGTLRWRAGSAVTPVSRANTRVQTQSAGTGYFGAVSVPVSTGRKVVFWLFSLSVGVGALALLYAFLGQEIFQPVEGTDNAFGHIWNFFCKVRVCSCLAAAPRRWAHLTCIRRRSGDTICGRFSPRPCAPQGVW